MMTLSGFPRPTLPARCRPLRLFVAVVVLAGAMAGVAVTSAASVAAVSGPGCPAQSPSNSPVRASDFRVAGGLARPVVLVHGWDSNAAALADDKKTPFDKLGSLLDSTKSLVAPVRTFAFDYGADAAEWASAPRIAACLADYLRAVSAAYTTAGGDGKVLAVGNSMGGLAIGFSTNPALVANPAGSVLGGVVTIDTPFLGSPWGSTSDAQIMQDVHHGVRGMLPWPPGSDAQTCLATHAGAAGMPGGCAVPVWLPAAVPLAEIGGDITVHRQLMGVEITTTDTGGDAIVTTASSLGYTHSGSGNPPVGTAPVTYVDRCDVTTGEAEIGLAGAVGNVGNVGTSLYSAFMTLATLGDQPLNSTAQTAFAAADIVAPCSHTNIINPADDAFAAHDVTKALNVDLARLDAADALAAQPVALPQVTCPTEYVPGGVLAPLPSSLPAPASLPAGLALAYYAVANGYLRVLAPTTWKCSALVSEDGGTVLNVWPLGQQSLTQGGKVGISAENEPACVSCIYYAVCPLIKVPTLVGDYGPCLSPPPSTEQLRRYTPDVLGLLDPPRVSGDALLSGGAYPSSGTLVFHNNFGPQGAGDSNVEEIGCALPASTQNVCALSNKDFLNRYE